MRSFAITALLATSALVLAACGSDDSGGGEPGGDQARVVDLVMSSTGAEGFELDRACVEEAVAELSDADAQSLADSGLANNADISAEGDAIGQRVFTECVDAASYLDALIASFGQDPTLDAECLRSALEGKNIDEIDAEVFDAATGCTIEG